MEASDQAELARGRRPPLFALFAGRPQRPRSPPRASSPTAPPDSHPPAKGPAPAPPSRPGSASREGSSRRCGEQRRRVHALGLQLTLVSLDLAEVYIAQGNERAARVWLLAERHEDEAKR